MKITKAAILISSLIISLIWVSLINEGLFAQSKNIPDNGTNFALIIGIENYDDSKWGKSEHSVRDAETIAGILIEKYNFKKNDVVLLTDNSPKAPTLENIFSELNNYMDRLSENDNLLIFYSGLSEEDDDGETYWIPKNARKDLKQLWVKHSVICNDILDSDTFKAKNVAIIADSVFSKRLLRSQPSTPSPYDLRYPEKIRELASQPSREVYFFGDKRWEEDEKYNNMSLFTYYLHKALDENWFKVIDLDNLIFNEEFLLEARRAAGAKPLRGRLKKSGLEMKGQKILTCVKEPPPINVVDAFVNPPKGEAGDNFIFEATTDRSAFEVYLEFQGKKFLMNGDGTHWKLKRSIKNIGDNLAFSVMAVNEENIEGKKQKIVLTTLAPAEGVVRVIDPVISPATGEAGDEFTFTAKTDIPSQKVSLIIADKNYDMQGTGTEWTIKTRIEDYGDLSYSIVAENEKGIVGLPKGGSFSIKAPKIRIVEHKASPLKGYAGDEYTITAKTDFPARSVELTIGNKKYAMEGSEKSWRIRREIGETGKQPFTITAINSEGIPGFSGTGEIITEERPPGIPDIEWVKPEMVFAGVDFAITARTSEKAEEVILEFDGKSISMEGSGKDWKYNTRVADIGSTTYRIIAKNKDGIEGKPQSGTITATEKQGVEIAQADVNPRQGNPGQTFTFTATTVESAKSAELHINGNKYPMTGSGKDWSAMRKIDEMGTWEFSIVALDNNNKPGRRYSGTLPVRAPLADITEAKARSLSGNDFAGEEYLFSATTNHQAKSVSINLAGVELPMEGSGTKWEIKRRIDETGKRKYSIVAKNIEGVEGKAFSGELNARYAVTPVNFSTGNIYAGEDFAVEVKTNAPSENVFMTIGQDRLPMAGSGTSWNLTTRIASIGSTDYRVVAIDKDGKEAVPATGKIAVAKKPAPLIKVDGIEISDPAIESYFTGLTYTFRARTEKPAKGAILNISGKQYKMTGSGTSWELKHVIDKAGTLNYSIAALNEDDVEGLPKSSSMDVKPESERYKDNKNGTLADLLTGKTISRFQENGDGTITDRLTRMMWTQSIPKRNTMTYEEAEAFVSKFSFAGYSGWRLPTEDEWNDLMDKNQSAPALPPGHPFKIRGNEAFWSKDSKGTRVYAANIYMGKTSPQNKDNLFNVLLVRRPE